MPFWLWTQMGPRKYVLHAVHIDAAWQMRLNRPCAAAMQPFCQITLTTCYHYYESRTWDLATTTWTACQEACCGVRSRQPSLLEIRTLQRLAHKQLNVPRSVEHAKWYVITTTTTVLRPFFRDYPGEPVPEENFWTVWCKRRLTEADTLTIWLGATPSGLTSAHLHHPPYFLRAGCPSCRTTNSV